MNILSGIWVPHPPAYSEGEGLTYALALAKKTQGLSLFLTLLGWFCVVLGALLAISGSVLGSESVDGAAGFLATLSAHRGLVCSTAAIVFAGAGWQILDRASAATKVSSISTRAILIGSSNGKYKNRSCDKVAYDACVEAKTAWLEGRMNNDRLENIVSSIAPPNSKIQ